MSDKTGISWTDSSWNPVTGCSQVSEGCRNCYAERDSHRWHRTSLPWTAPNAWANVVLRADRLILPLYPSFGPKIFTNSVSDLNHEHVPIEYLDKCYGIMALASVAQPHKVFQKLTKRAERMRRYVNDPRTPARVYAHAAALAASIVAHRKLRSTVTPAVVEQLLSWPYTWPLPNVWEGVSVEDDRAASERLPELFITRCALPWVSFEPLLGPIDGPGMGGYARLNGLRWAVIGGESGPGYRHMDPQWAEDLARELTRAKVPVWFKQHSGPRAGMGAHWLGGERYAERPAGVS